MTFNFFQNIYEALHLNQDKELIFWPGVGKDKAAASFSGNDIKIQVSAVRQALESLPLQKGQKVLLGIPVSFHLICSLLAVMATGAIPVLPPAKISKVTLVRLLSRNNIKLVLLENTPSPMFRLLAKVLGIKLLPVNLINISRSATWCCACNTR